MPWLKLDDNFITNPKLLSTTLEEKALHFWWMGYCAKELTDGLVERHLIPIIAAMAGVTNWQPAVDGLVEKGLWEVDGDNYRIHDYLEYNPSREQVLEDRAEARERMHKIRSQDVRANVTRSSQDVRVRLNDPVPVPVPDIHEESICAANASQSEHDEEKPATSGYTDEFETFWQSYPRKLDKAAAFRAWKARLKGKAPPSDMVSAARHYAEYCELRGVETQYVKHAATFLGPDRPFAEFVAGLPEPVPRKPRANGSARASPAVYHDTGPPVRTGAALEAEVDALLAEFGGDV
jgi:hypothetical protein